MNTQPSSQAPRSALSRAGRSSEGRYLLLKPMINILFWVFVFMGVFVAVSLSKGVPALRVTYQYYPVPGGSRIITSARYVSPLGWVESSYPYGDSLIVFIPLDKKYTSWMPWRNDPD